jgi:hypothetical protein
VCAVVFVVPNPKLHPKSKTLKKWKWCFKLSVWQKTKYNLKLIKYKGIWGYTHIIFDGDIKDKLVMQLAAKKNKSIHYWKKK